MLSAERVIADERSVTGPPEQRLVWLLGPAFVAAIAYVDPGNVAANLTAGADHGYLLLWVLVLANVMAMIVQYLSAKLGLVTGRSLAEILGDRLPRGKRLMFWAQAEVVAASTDLAEVMGGAVALRILFDLPLMTGGIIIGVVSTLMLAVQSHRGQRAFESIVTGLLAVITIGFLAGLAHSRVDGGDVAAGLVPRLDGSETVLLAASMLGATIMPHAIYLHSALARDRHGASTEAGRVRRLLTATRIDVMLALVIAGSVNIAMLVVAAANLSGARGIDSIDGAHQAIQSALGSAMGALFGVALLAAGLASTSVGCYAGASIMEGLLHVRVPMLLRRVVLLVPVLIVIGMDVEPTRALVISQAVLSLGIPFALVPLTRYTADEQLMGPFVNGRLLTRGAWIITTLVIVLNGALVALSSPLAG